MKKKIISAIMALSFAFCGIAAMNISASAADQYPSDPSTITLKIGDLSSGSNVYNTKISGLDKYENCPVLCNFPGNIIYHGPSGDPECGTVKNGIADCSVFSGMAGVPGTSDVVFSVDTVGEGDFVDISSVKIVVEEPVINTNAPENITSGSTLDLSATLDNTSLTNEKNDYYNDPANWSYDDYCQCNRLNRGSGEYDHLIAYQPSIEIVEGADLIDVSGTDFSNTLSASEKITFKGTGTVKLKIKFTQYKTDMYWMGNLTTHEWYTYDPEKVITINVTKDGTAPASVSDISGLKEAVNTNGAIKAASYTAASYKAYTQALANAKAVLADSSATSKEVTDAKETLAKAVKGLVMSASNNTNTADSVYYSGVPYAIVLATLVCTAVTVKGMKVYKKKFTV